MDIAGGANPAVEITSGGIAGIAGPANSTTITTLGAFSLMQIEGSNSGSDVFNVRSSNPGTLLLSGRGGNDEVNVGSLGGSLDTVLGGMSIDLGAGMDVVRVNDAGDSSANTYSVSPTALTRSGAGGAVFGSVPEQIIVNAGAGLNRFDVTPATNAQGTAITINGAAPFVPDPAPGDFLNYQGKGNLTITGVGSGTIAQAGFVPVSYTSIETLDATQGYGVLNVTANLLNVAAQNDGVPDTFELRGNYGNFELYYRNTASQPVFVFGGANDAFTQLNFLGSADDDTLIVDTTNGAVDIAQGIYFEGEAGQDLLVLQGGTATLDTYTPGPVLGTGSSVMNFGAATQRVYFTGLEPVIDSVSGPLVVNGNAADNAISYGPGAAASFGRVTVDAQEYIDFTNKTTLTLEAGAGVDTISLNHGATPTGLTAITVAGGDPTSSPDTLFVNGTLAANPIFFQPLSLGSAIVTGAGPVPITATGIGAIKLDGQGGSDALVVVGGSGDDTITHTPGSAADEGTVRVNGFLGLSYSNLGNLGSLAISGGAGTDTFLAEGTESADAFTVDAAGNLAAPGRLSIARTNFENLTLRGFGGSDSFTLAAGATLGTVSIDAGSGGTDVLRISGTAASADAFTATLGVATGTGAVAANAIAIGYSGVESLVLEAQGGVAGGGENDALTINDNAADNVWNVGAGPASSDRVQVAGREAIDFNNFSGVTLVNTAGADRFIVAPSQLNGSDTLTLDADNAAASIDDVVEIVGTEGADNITITADRIAVGSATPILLAGTGAGFKQVKIDARGGDDVITVDVAAGAGGLIPTPVLVAGGAGLDALRITGAPGVAVDEVIYSAGSTPGDGQLRTESAANAALMTIDFTGVEPLTDLLPAARLTVLGNDGDNAITYSNGAAGNGIVAVDALSAIEFSNKATLAISSLGGNDTITLNNPTAAAPTGLAAIEVQGGNPTGGDTIVFNGRVGTADDLNIAPSAAGGTIFGGAVPVSFSGADRILAVGQTNENDRLRVAGTAGNDIYEFTSGATLDAGIFTGERTGAGGFNFTPVEFTGFRGMLSGLTDPAAGSDRLVVNGSGTDDVVRFSESITTPGAFVVQINGGTELFTSSNAAIVLRGAGGDDTFLLDFDPATAPVQLGRVLTVQGGEGDDRLQYLSAAGAATSIDFGGSTIVSGGANVVSFDGIDSIVHVSNNGALAVAGTSSSETFIYTPTDTNSGTLTAIGQPALQFSGVTGTFALQLGGGAADSLTVAGTSGAEAINVVRGAISTTVAVGASKPVALTSVGAEGITIESGAGDDTIVISGSGGPNIFVDGGGQTGADALAITYANAGNLSVSGNTVTHSADGSVSHIGVESVTVTGAAGANTLTAYGTQGDDAITLTRDESDPANPNQLQIGAGPQFFFRNFSAITVQGMAGDDTFTVDQAALLPTSGSVILAGGEGNDSLHVRGSTGANAITYVPESALGAGSFGITGAAAITFTGMGGASFDGRGGSDTLTIALAAGAPGSAAVYTPGANPDAAHLDLRRLGSGVAMTPLDFANLGAFGSVTFGGTAVLEVHGTAGEDLFTQTAAGVLTLHRADQQNSVRTTVDIHTATVGQLELRGLGGDDQFTVSPSPLTNLVIDGGESSIGDIVVLNGNGAAALNVDITPTSSVLFTGAGYTRVAVTGAELIGTVTGNQNVNVTTNGRDEVIEITPAGANTVELTMDRNTGAVPTFSFAGIGTFTIDVGGGSDALIVHGTQGDDAITVTRNATVTTATIIGREAINFTNAESLAIHGDAGSDALTVDAVTGPVLVPVAFDGGSGSDLLTLTGGTATTDIYTPGPQPGSGSSVITFTSNGGGTQRVSFSNIEPVIDLVPATTLIVNAGDADNAIAYRQGATTVRGLVAVDDQEVIEFSSKGNLVINAGGGTDTISLSNPFTPTALTAITVDGGDPIGNDQLIITGAAGVTQDLLVSPTAAGAGTITPYVGFGAPGFVPTTFSGIEALAVTGQAAEADILRVAGTAGADTLEITPGAALDSGSITGFATGAAPFAYTPMTFSGMTGFIGAGVGFGAADTVILNGTLAADTFRFSESTAFPGLRSAAVNSHTEIFLQDSSITLRGFAGDDTFQVSFAPSGDARPIAIEGAEGNDTINHAANAGAVTTLDLHASTLTSTGANPITFGGVETINQSSSGTSSTLTVQGRTGADELTYTPTGANAGTVRDGRSLTGLHLNFTGVGGAFTIDGAGGSDVVTVLATQDADTITTDGALVTVAGLKPVDLANAEALRLLGQAGEDTFNVTPAANLPIFVDGGDPIGSTPGDLLNLFPTGAFTVEPGPQKDEGGLRSATDGRVSWDHVEGITIAGGGPALIMGTNGDDDITIIARDASTHSTLGANTPGVQDFTVSVNDGPDILFIDQPALFVDALSGDDDIVARTPAPNQADWDVDITIAAGPAASGNPAEGDRLVLETPGTNTVTYTPTAGAPDQGGFLLDQATNDSSITFAPFTIPALNHVSSPGGIERVEYDGQNGNDTFTVLGTSGADTITHTPGTDGDAGQVRVGNLLAVHYENLGAGAMLTVDGQGGIDTLQVDGTQNNDTFNVAAATGAVSVNARLVLNKLATENVTLRGLDGDDTFNLPGGQGYTTINVEAGNSSGGDVVNLTGALATSETVNIAPDAANSTEQDITGLGGTINVSGAELIRYFGDSADDTLRIDAGPQDNTIRVEGGDAAAGGMDLVLSDSLPKIHFAGLNTFTLAPGDGVDVATFATAGLTGALPGNYRFESGSNDTLIIEGQDGSGAQNDSLTVTNPGGAGFVRVRDNNSIVVGVTVTDIGGAARLGINTLGGDDLVTVDVNGTALIHGPTLTVDGGTGSDRLVLSGTSSTTVASTSYSPSPIPGSGRIVMNDGLPMTIDVLHVEPILTTVPTQSLIVNGTDGNNAINYSRGSVAANGFVSVDALGAIEFSNAGALIINAGAGVDHVHLNNVATPTALTTIAVNGGDSTDRDTLVVNGTPSQDAINYAPSAYDAGTFTINALPVISFTAAEDIVLNGVGGDDLVTVTTPLGLHQVELFPGETEDSGRIAIRDSIRATLAGLSLTNLGNSATLAIADASGTRADDLVYNARALANGADVFNVGIDGVGVITLTESSVVGAAEQFLRVNTPGIRNLTLNSFGGDDVFNLQATAIYANTLLNAGDSSGQDTVHLTGDETAVSVTMGAIRGGALVTGGLLGSVTVSGTEELNLSNGAGDINVLGTAKPDLFHVTPTDAAKATLFAEGFTPVVKTTNTGLLTFLEGTSNALDSDQVTVHGTTQNDIITIARGANTTVQVNALKLVNITAANVPTLLVRGEQGDDRFDVSGAGGPALTVDGNTPVSLNTVLAQIAGDTVRVIGAVGAANEFTVQQGQTTDSGSIQLGADVTQFQGIEAVTLDANGGVGMDTATYIASNADNDIVIAINEGVDATIASDAQPVVTLTGFSNGSVIGINALGGDDTISTFIGNAVAQKFAFIGITGGQATSEGDKVIINATSAQDAIRYVPTGVGAGLVSIANTPTVIFGTSEHLTVNGQGGNDRLTIVSPAGAQELQFFAGETTDRGRVAIHEPANVGAGFGGVTYVALDYENVATGELTLADADDLRADDLIFNGRDKANASDVISVDATNVTGQIRLNEAAVAGGAALAIPVNAPGIRNLTLSGLAGDDLFNVTAPAAGLQFANILVDGGDGAGADVVNLNGNGANVAVTIGATNGAASVTGGGLARTGVTLANDEVLNLNTGVGNIDVLGTNKSDFFHVTPTAPTKATLHADGFHPIVHTTNTGLLTFAEGNANDGDSLTVHGTTQDDQVTITRGANTTVLVDPAGASAPAALKLVNVTAANIEALVVRGELGSDTLEVFGGGGPRLTVDGNQPLSKPQHDTLIVHGSAGADAFTQTEGQTTDSGSVRLVNASGDDVTQFQGIEEVILEGGNPGAGGPGPGDTATFVANNADNDIVLTVLGGDSARVSIDAQPEVTLRAFGNGSTINVNSLAGDDAVSIVIASRDASNFATVNVDGGQPAASDKLTVNAVPLHDDNLMVQPLATGKGQIRNNTLAFPVLNYAGIEHMEMVGQSSIEKDALLHNFGPSDTTIELTPGRSPDAGRMTGFTSGNNENFAFVPIDFTGFLGFVTAPNAIAQPGTHTLIVNGSGADDTFRFGTHQPFGPTFPSIVVNTGANAHTPVYFSNGLTRVILRGLDGSDTFNLDFDAANTTAPVHIAVEGGDSDGSSDVINHRSIANAETVVNLDGTIVSTGANLVEFAGVERINQTSAGATSTLRYIGTSGPDDIHYRPTGALTGEVTTAGSKLLTTFAGVQGNFIINPNANVDTVTTHGTAGTDSITVLRGSQTAITVNALKTVRVETGTAELIAVAAGTGNDTITVSGVDGVLPGVHGPLVIDGGSPGNSTEPQADTLIVNVPAGTTTLAPGATADAGAIYAPQSADVAFGGFEFLTINGSDPLADSLVVQGTQDRDTITAAHTGGVNQVLVNDRIATRFTNFFNLTLDGRAGDDFLSVTPTGITVNNLTVIGGSPTANDALLVDGTSATEAFVVALNGVNAGSVAVGASPVVSFTTVEALKVNGLGGNDPLTVISPAGAQDIRFTAGATVDSGTVQAASLVPVQFQGLGATAAVTLADASNTRVDHLVFHGTTADDLFAVTGSSVRLNNQITVLAAGAASATLEGIDGNDIASVTATSVFTSLTLAVETANVTGNGTAASAGLGGTAATVSGAGLGAISLPGAHTLNLNNAAGAITVLGTSGADDLHARATGAETATVNLTNFVTRLNTTGTGALTLDAQGGADAITVLGNATANTVMISLGAITNVTTDGQKTIGTLAAAAESLMVKSGEGNDTVTVTGTGGVPVTLDLGMGNDTVNASAVTVDGLTILAGDGNDTIIGGAGMDLIFGGEGNDLVTGGPGNDHFFGGDGSDTFVWNPGDASDLVEGGDGENLLVFNGAAVAEAFTARANGNRVALSRDVGGVTMDLANVQQINLTAGGGADTLTVHDLTGTELRTIHADLGTGDGAVDTVTVHGREVADNALVSATGGVVNVTGLHTAIRLTGAALTDSVIVKGNAGNDTLTGDSTASLAVSLTLEGGAGNDTLHADGTLRGGAGDDTLTGGTNPNLLEGGAGNDVLDGGAGGDTLLGGEGDDLLTGGLGLDILDGGAGFDTLPISGTPSNDRIEISQPSAGSFLHTLNGATETDTIAGIEAATVSAGAGDDLIQVIQGDALIATPLASVRVVVNAGESVVGDRLVVIDDGLGDVMIQRQGQSQNVGSITTGALASVFYSGVEQVQPLSGGADGAGKLVIFRHDAFEGNDSMLTSAHLGAGAGLNADLTIDPSTDAGFGVPADADFFRVQALETGKLSFNVYFQTVGTLANGRDGLVDDGRLTMVVLDSKGAVKATGAVSGFGSTASIFSPQGEVYYLKVTGLTADTINAYDVTVTSAALPGFSGGNGNPGSGGNPGGGLASFTAAVNYETGKRPRGVAVGDVNGDGNADFVTADSRNRTVSVALGRGDGTFLAAEAFPVQGRFVTSVALADFDEDGDLDIMAASRFSNKLVHLEGDGAGNFGAPIDFKMAGAKKVISLRAVDLNDDGHMDVVTANGKGKNLTTFIGKGDGTFQSQVNFATAGKGPRDLAIGDFNSDGILDAVVANRRSHDVSFLPGDGLGAFGPAVLFDAGRKPVSIVAGDFDGDGNLDAAVAHASGKYLSVLRGAGLGGSLAFEQQVQVKYSRKDKPQAINAGDFNLDGKLDLVLSNLRGRDISVLLGNGNTTFSEPFDFFTNRHMGRDPQSIVVADVNNDGLADLLVANPTTRDVSVLLRNTAI